MCPPPSARRPPPGRGCSHGRRRRSRQCRCTRRRAPARHRAECGGRSGTRRHPGPRLAPRRNSVLGPGWPPPSRSMSLCRRRSRPGRARERHPGPRNPKPGARSGKRPRPPRRTRTELGSGRFCAASPAWAGAPPKPTGKNVVSPTNKGASPSTVHAVTKLSVVPQLAFPHRHFLTGISLLFGPRRILDGGQFQVDGAGRLWT